MKYDNDFWNVKFSNVNFREILVLLNLHRF